MPVHCLKSDRNDVDMDGRKGQEELGGGWGGKKVTGIYCMKKYLCSIKEKKSRKSTEHMRKMKS